MEPKKDVLEHLGGIKLTLFLIKCLVFRFNKGIQIRQDRVILRTQMVKITLIMDTPLGIQFLEHDLDNINLPVRKILIAAEKVF